MRNLEIVHLFLGWLFVQDLKYVTLMATISLLSKIYDVESPFYVILTHSP